MRKARLVKGMEQKSPGAEVISWTLVTRLRFLPQDSYVGREAAFWRTSEYFVNIKEKRESVPTIHQELVQFCLPWAQIGCVGVSGFFEYCLSWPVWRLLRNLTYTGTAMGAPWLSIRKDQKKELYCLLCISSFIALELRSGIKTIFYRYFMVVFLQEDLGACQYLCGISLFLSLMVCW